MKKYLLLFSLLFWTGSAFAYVNVNGELVCPNAKKEGKSLICQVQLANHGCSDVKITRGVALFAGNSSGTVSGIGIWGPWVRNILANKIIPAGDAAECAANGGSYAATPGTLTSAVLIIDPAPAGIAPTVGTAIVEMELTELNPAATDPNDDIVVNAMVQILPSP